MLVWSVLTLLLAAGSLWATTNSWRYPVPTGGTQLTLGDVIYARDANNLGNISPSTTGRPLVSAGASTAPTFGTATVAGGGTGQTSYTTGDILYASSASALSKLAAVASGKVIRAAGTSTASAYSTFTIPDTFATGDMLYTSATNTLTALSAVAAGQLLASAGTSTAPAYTANPTITGYYAGVEITPPAAGAANSWRMYASDVGGKSVMYVIFGTGAAQSFATQP